MDTLVVRVYFAFVASIFLLTEIVSISINNSISRIKPQPKFVTKRYTAETHGNYHCDKYIQHLAQELGVLPLSLVSFSSFLSALQSPTRDSDKRAVQAFRMMHPMDDDRISHEVWLRLLYTCTIDMPQRDVAENMLKESPEVYKLLRPTDTMLQRVVKLGMSQTLQTMAKKGLYDEGHYYYTRDEDGNSLIHLAVKSGNTAIVNELSKLLLDKMIFLLDGPESLNKEGKRPWDLASEGLNYGMKNLLNSLYILYHRDDARGIQPPKRPPEHIMPEIRVIEPVKIEQGRSILSEPTMKFRPPPYNKHTAANSLSINHHGSGIIGPTVSTNNPEGTQRGFGGIGREFGMTSRTVTSILVVIGTVVLVVIVFGIFLVLTRPDTVTEKRF